MAFYPGQPTLHLASDRWQCQYLITQFLQGRCPSCHLTNRVKALKAYFTSQIVSKHGRVDECSCWSAEQCHHKFMAPIVWQAIYSVISKTFFLYCCPSNTYRKAVLNNGKWKEVVASALASNFYQTVPPHLSVWHCLQPTFQELLHIKADINQMRTSADHWRRIFNTIPLMPFVIPQ